MGHKMFSFLTEMHSVPDMISLICTGLHQYTIFYWFNWELPMLMTLTSEKIFVYKFTRMTKTTEKLHTTEKLAVKVVFCGRNHKQPSLP